MARLTFSDVYAYNGKRSRWVGEFACTDRYPLMTIHTMKAALYVLTIDYSALYILPVIIHYILPVIPRKVAVRQAAFYSALYIAGYFRRRPSRFADL